MHSIQVSLLKVPSNRQRREFDHQEVVNLSSSIGQVGLIHPLTIRKEGEDYLLVAGERRLKAITYLWELGEQLRCGEILYPEGTVPCIYQGELSEVDAFEVELEENIRRADLTWQERATATAQLFELRELQALRANRPVPTVKEIATEVRGSNANDQAVIREDLILSRNLSDPDIQKAKTAGDAMKILKRKDELKRSERMGELVGKTFTSEIHNILLGNCFELMGKIPSESFDCILTDPPYGMGAQDFGDSGGKAGAHFYDDSYENWQNLMHALAPESFRLTKSKAHLYCFCDFDRFHEAKLYFENAGWKVFRTPLIWVNPTAMRTPWPDKGPQRKYQTVLFAIKGDKNVTRIYSDVLTYSSDPNLNHPAQKPVALYQDLLRRSCIAGDSVLDPFMGSGTIIPAAHEMKIRATGIEQDASAYGIAVERLRALS